MEKLKLFGAYQPEIRGHEYLLLCFSPSSLPVQQLWRNNGVSADFLADYFVTFFPYSDREEAEMLSPSRRADIRGTVSYIANELLENAMKYAEPSNANSQKVCDKKAISLSLHLLEDAFIFYVSNAIEHDKVADFQKVIKDLLSCDVAERYFQQLEYNALHADETEADNTLEANSNSALMGYLTMLHDYDAELGWKFEYVDATVARVTTMVKLKAI